MFLHAVYMFACVRGLHVHVYVFKRAELGSCRDHLGEQWRFSSTRAFDWIQCFRAAAHKHREPDRKFTDPRTPTCTHGDTKGGTSAQIHLGTL